jgi:hypothetical protein
MRSAVSAPWPRLALAFAAVLSVAGSGIVFASGSDSTYPRPLNGYFQGPSPVSPNTITQYTLLINFTSGPSATFVGTYDAGGPFFSASQGNFLGSTSNYSSVGASGKVLLTGKFTAQNATVTVNRAILVQ